MTYIAPRPILPFSESQTNTERGKQSGRTMVGRKVLSMLKKRPAVPSSSAVAPPPVEEGRAKSLARKVVSGALICLTGGVALSAIDDLVIYRGCSSKAMERASKNQAIIEALGDPIVRGPWYNASLAVAHKRQSVSCTFPVSGPQGTGIFQLKAVRNGDDTWFTILRPRDWDILVMEALLHVPGNEKTEQTFRISVLDNPPMDCKPCVAARAPQPSPKNAEEKQSQAPVQAQAS